MPSRFAHSAGDEGEDLLGKRDHNAARDGEHAVCHERVLERVSLREAIDQLPERERQVIALRYFHDMTQDAASRVLGVSQVQVSRLERRAIGRLRELLS